MSYANKYRYQHINDLIVSVLSFIVPILDNTRAVEFAKEILPRRDRPAGNIPPEYFFGWLERKQW